MLSWSSHYLQFSELLGFVPNHNRTIPADEKGNTRYLSDPPNKARAFDSRYPEAIRAVASRQAQR